MISFDSIHGAAAASVGQRGDRHSLNTQKRNRTSTIEATSGHQTHHRGNSHNVQELHNAYQGKAQSGPSVMHSTRQSNHQPGSSGVGMYQTVQTEAPQQLFLPGTMKVQMGRKAPVT